jgi:tetratricopeptide (TPR) repeat protein
MRSATIRGLLRGKRDYDHALADFEQSIQLDPKLGNAYRNRGHIWLDKRDYDRAIADYGEVIRLEPKNVNAYADRCWALYIKKAFDRALKDCDQAIEIDPKLAYLFNRRGLIWVEQRDFDRAIADYTQAIRIDSKYALAYYNRGLAWSSRRDLDRAVADFGEAITLNPRYTDAYMQRAYAHKQKHDYDRAIADYDQAVALNPKNVFAFASRGIAWLDKHDYGRALADFDEAIRLDPDYTAAWTNRGLALERKGEVEQARKNFDAALALPQKYRDGKWAHDTARERLAALMSPRRPTQPSEAQNSQQGSGSRTSPRTSIERGPRIALLVGNSAYPDANPALSQTKKDTLALADEMKRMGFDTEIAENLTKLGMQRAIDNFKKKTKPGAIALFYFNGFGVQTNRQTYLLPTDAQIWNEADVRRDGTNLETVLEELNREGATVKIAIIDASRRNPYERRFRSSAAGLAPVNIAKDSLVIYSVGVGQTLGETAGEQGLFMTELLKELRAPGSRPRRFLLARASASREDPTRIKSLGWHHPSSRAFISCLPAIRPRNAAAPAELRAYDADMAGAAPALGPSFPSRC